MEPHILKRVLERLPEEMFYDPRNAVNREEEYYRCILEKPVPGYILAGLNCTDDSDILSQVICALYDDLWHEEQEKLAGAV